MLSTVGYLPFNFSIYTSLEFSINKVQMTACNKTLILCIDTIIGYAFSPTVNNRSLHTSDDDLRYIIII